MSLLTAEKPKVDAEPLANGSRHRLMWQSELPEGQTYVYFIQGKPGTEIKIGYTNRVGKRVSTLQTGNPHELHELVVLPAPRSAEAAYHRLLRTENVLGEWFMGPLTSDLLWHVHEVSERMVSAYDGSGRAPDIFSFDSRIERGPFGPDLEPVTPVRPRLEVVPAGPVIPMVPRSVKSRLRAVPWKPDPTPPEGDVPWGRKPPAWYGEARREPRCPADPPPFGKTNFT